MILVSLITITQIISLTIYRKDLKMTEQTFSYSKSEIVSWIIDNYLSVFPDAIFEYSGNWDDSYGGWRFITSLNKCVEIFYSLKDESFIRIRLIRIDLSNDKIQSNIVFRGCLPAAEDFQSIDYGFLKKLLQQIDKFGGK